MPDHWDSRMVRPGDYVIRRNGVEVAWLTMVDSIRQQHFIGAQVAEVVGEAVRRHEAHEAVSPSQRPAVNWVELGWPDQETHDELFEELRDRARRYAGPVRRRLKAEWQRRGFTKPMRFDDMVEWERLVVSAPQLVREETAA